MAATVLIVDDVPFVRETLAEIFSRGGYQVIGQGADGHQAVELYFKLKPTLVTMDVVMPHLSGIEAARRIIKSDKDANIIMISALGQENLVMEAINAGARDYITKPFKAQDIYKAAERATMFAKDKGQGAVMGGRS
jgi:two-component system, chemotaxis family, chemotaxis protein CheY